MTVGGGRRHREPARRRRSSTSRPCSPWRPRRTSRSTRAALRQPVQRLQPDRQRRHGQDRERQLDERVRGLRRPVVRRTRRTRSSRPRPPKASRSSSPSGDQGAQGCNINGEVSASTGHRPVAQAVDPSTGTLYIANKSSNTVSVDSEGSTSNPAELRPPTLGLRPDRIRPRRSRARRGGWEGVRGRHSTSTLTAISTSTCNQTATSGCSSPAQIASGGHLNAPTALVVNGSDHSTWPTQTARWRCTTSAPRPTPTWRRWPCHPGPCRQRWPSTPPMAMSTSPTAPTTGSSTSTPRRATPTHHDGMFEPRRRRSRSAMTPSPWRSPAAAGDLYVANAGTGGGISVVSLSTHAVVSTISTSQTLERDRAWCSPSVCHPTATRSSPC